MVLPKKMSQKHLENSALSPLPPGHFTRYFWKLLRYYVGYLTFEDLRDAYKEKKGSAFSLKTFHQKVLEIGPAPFPVVSHYLLEK